MSDFMVEVLDVHFAFQDSKEELYLNPETEGSISVEEIFPEEIIIF